MKATKATVHGSEKVATETGRGSEKAAKGTARVTDKAAQGTAHGVKKVVSKSSKFQAPLGRDQARQPFMN